MSPEATVDITALQKLAAQAATTSQFNTEIVRNAWNTLQRRRREANRAARRAARESEYDIEVAEDPMAYAWIEQLWTDHLIIKFEDGQGEYIKVPYTVEAPGASIDNVKFGAPQRVRVEYVAASNGEQALAQILEWRLANSGPPAFLKDKGSSGSGGKPSGSTEKREGGNGGKGTGSASAQPKIKSLSELDSAIKAFSQSKSKAQYKAQLLAAARKLNASDAVIKRIQALSVPGGSGSGSGDKGSPNFRSSKVSADSVAASADSEGDITALARVRTMAGARRYRKPIGTLLNNEAPGGDSLATVAKAGSRKGPGATADKLRSSIKDVAREKSYKGGDVFGDIGNEGKLKSALGQISRLPDGKRGEAAAEVVKAAQALGLTSLVPSSVKRLYRQWISQSKIDQPSKAPKAKAKS